ncbi:MAG TPA: hypothetical protein VFW76_02680 [Ktedonobacterales bacterium]|nr:hypothetical protein [Ktedonobacterales bacterium]
MNEIMQNFLIGTVLPGMVFPLLIALVAILGVARWPRTLLVLALVALALRGLGIASAHFLLGDMEHVLPIPVSEFLLVIGSPIINLSISVTTVGVFLALVLAARARTWGWFSVIVLTAIISALAANFAFSLYGLLVFVPSSQAYQTNLQPPYIIITNALASLNILAIVLYALLGQRETAITTTRASTASMSDDPTLP